MPKHFEVQSYLRRPFIVQAVMVTEKNLDEVAVWCGGTVNRETKRHYVEVPVSKVTNELQRRGFINHYVVKAERGYRVYTYKTFHDNFKADSGDDPNYGQHI